MPKSFLHFINTGFYSGLSPVAPGTCGTLLCAALIAIFWNCFNLSPEYISLFSPLNLALFSTVLGLASIRLYYNQNTEGDDCAKFDPQEVVIDEFAGFLTTLSFLPPNNLSIILAFIGFRIFDITKPWPIKFFEKFRSPWGIMMDDIVAGLWAGTILHILISV